MLISSTDWHENWAMNVHHNREDNTTTTVPLKRTYAVYVAWSALFISTLKLICENTKHMLTLWGPADISAATPCARVILAKTPATQTPTSPPTVN
jgi:hypothetical protein